MRWSSSSDFGPLILLIVILLAGAAFMFPILFSYLFVAGIAIAILAAVAMMAYVIYWFIHNYSSPITRVEARVIRKRMKDWDVSIQPDSPETAAARLGMMGRDPQSAAKAWAKSAGQNDSPELTFASGVYYFVTFDVAGKEMEFVVPESTYTSATEGAQGLLVYQREKFRYFVLGV